MRQRVVLDGHGMLSRDLPLRLAGRLSCLGAREQCLPGWETAMDSDSAGGVCCSFFMDFCFGAVPVGACLNAI